MRSSSRTSISSSRAATTRRRTTRSSERSPTAFRTSTSKCDHRARVHRHDALRRARLRGEGPRSRVRDAACLRCSGRRGRRHGRRAEPDSLGAPSLGGRVPALALLLLVRWVGDRFEPGLGIAAAVTLGGATLVLPFATLFFSHVLAATLGFAAFAVLLLEREGAPRMRLVALAGLVAGLAVTVEYPLGLGAAALCLYACSRPPRLRRGLTFGGAAPSGLLPALAFNQWAFGSPFRFPYEGWTVGQGAKPLPGIFGLTVPDFTPRSRFCSHRRASPRSPRGPSAPLCSPRAAGAPKACSSSRSRLRTCSTTRRSSSRSAAHRPVPAISSQPFRSSLPGSHRRSVAFPARRSDWPSPPARSWPRRPSPHRSPPGTGRCCTAFARAAT